MEEGGLTGDAWREPGQLSDAAQLGAEGYEELEVGAVVPDSDPAESVLTMAAAAPVGIIVTSGRSFRLVYANPAARELLGADRMLVRGQPFEQLFADSDASRCTIVLRRVLETGRALVDVGMLVGARRSRAARHREGSASTGGGEGERDGIQLWRLSAWPLDPTAQPAECRLALCIHATGSASRAYRDYRALMAAMRGLNERLLLAALQEQEETERARATSATISDFIATMSHELRTPLTAIMGYQELLAEGISGPVTPTQARQLDRIRTGANHLLTVINSILSFARMDAGRESVQCSDVDVGQLLEETYALVLPTAAGKDLELRMDVPSPAITLNTDRDKVRQILVNLAANAVKFTERGEVVLRARASGDVTEFVVQDTGIGIEREYLGRIFDPFWRAEEVRSGSAGGTGLGLSVSQRLAHLLGGEVTVRSAKGKGSKFTLRLPLRAGAV